VVVPNGNVEPEDGAHVTKAIGPSRLSVAVGVVKLTTEPPGPFASTVRFDGMLERTGAVRSTTVTVKLAWAVLPCPSLAEQVTVVAPNGKVAPDAGLQDGEIAPATRSDAVAV